MEKKKTTVRKTKVAKAPVSDFSVILTTGEKDYNFEGENLLVLHKFEPSKITGKTTIRITRNGLTYLKHMKPMLLKKFLVNATYLKILEKQISKLLK